MTAWNFQIRALGAAMVLFATGAAEAALTEQQVNEALGSVPGVAWSVESTDAEAWTVSGTGATQALKFSSAVATGTFALKATVTGPGVLELTASRSNLPFTSALLMDGEARPIAFWGTNRIAVGEGTHTVTWQGERSNWQSPSTTSATFKAAKWEPYAPLPVQAGAEDGVTLSGGWVGQDRWHRGDGGAAFSQVGAHATQPALQADFAGPGILTYWTRSWGHPAIVTIDGQEKGTINDYNLLRWSRRWHEVGAGSHVATWTPKLSVMDLVVDGMQVVQEVDLTTALDIPGRAWTSTLSGERRAIGLPTDDAVGGSAAVMTETASFSTELTGSGIFKIRQRGSVPVFGLNGYHLDHGSIPDPGSEWVTQAVVIPEAGGTLSIAANSFEAEFDAAEWLPTPATFAGIFGFPEQETSTGGDGTWVVVPNGDAGRFEAKTTLTQPAQTAWAEMNLTGPRKVTFGYEADPRGRLEFLVDGVVLWDSAVQGTGNRVTLEIPAGQHVVRCVARNVAGYEGWAFEAVIREIKVLADESVGRISEALGYQAPWAYAGEWEKVAAPAHDGNAALRPVVPDGAAAEAAVLGTMVTGPGYFKFWTKGPADSTTSGLMMHGDIFWHWHPQMVPLADEWSEHRIWFPQGTHQVKLGLGGSPLDMADIYLDEMSFTPSAPASLDAVLTGEPLVWENDPQRPWTAVVKEPGTPAVVVSPLRNDGNPPDELWESGRLAAKVTGPGVLKFKWKGEGRTTTLGLLVNGEPPTEWWWEQPTASIEIPAGENKIEWVVSAGTGSWVELSEVDWQPWPESTLASALDTPEGVAWESGGDAVFTGRPDADATNGTAAHVRLESGQSSWIEGTMDGPGVFDFWLRKTAMGGDAWQYSVTWVVTVDGTEVLRSGEQSWNPIWVRGEGQHKVRVTFMNPQSAPISGLMDDVTWIPLVQRAMDASWSANVSEPVNGYEGPDGSGYVLRTSYFTPSWIEKTVTGPCEVSWVSLLVGGEDLIGGQPTVTVDGKAPVVIGREYDRDRHVVIVPAGTHVIRWSNVTEHGEGYGTIMPEEKQGSYWQITDPVVSPGVSGIAELLDSPDSCWLVQGWSGGMTLGGLAMDGVDAFMGGSDRRFHYLNLSSAAQRLRGGIRYESDETWREMRRVVEQGEALQWAGPYGFAQAVAFGLDMFTAEDLTEVPLHEAVDLAEELPPQEGWRGIVSATESADGVDSAWSFVNTLFQSHDTGMTVNTAGRVRFRWKHQGASSLEVRLNGAPLPLAAGGEWTEVSFEVGNGENQITWLHENVEGTSEFAAGEAWLDAISFEELATWDLTAAAAAGTGVVLSTDEPLDDLLQWKAVKATLPGGEVVSAARAATGSAMLRASITGPTVVNFRGACFADKAAETMAGRNAHGGKFESSGGGTWETGGSGGEPAGYELTVKMGEKIVGSVPYRDGVEWSDVSFFVPEGAHEVTWQLNRLTSRSIPDFFNREAATWRDLQGWVSGIWLESARSRFDRWAETLPEGKRGPDEDADGDGVSNVLEYAFRSSSADPSSVPLQVTGRKGPPNGWLLTLDGGYWVIGPEGTVWVPYDQSTPTAAYELMVPYLSQFVDARVEMSGDLESWDEHPVQWLEERPVIDLVIPGVTGNTDTHQSVRIPLYQGEGSKFFRVRVAVPE